MNYLVTQGKKAPTTTDFDAEEAEGFEDAVGLRDIATPDAELATKQIAEIVNNNLSGKVAYLSGVPNKGAIEVQPNGGAEKANDISNMWVVDLTLNGCECLDYHQC